MGSGDSNKIVIIMMKLALTLVSLVATIAAQEEAAKETPLWFLETSLDGPFSERSSACSGLLASKQDEASFGPIFIPEDQDANICIRFPARDGRPETWRHDLGNKGACANQCCEFKPPLRNPPPPSPTGSRQLTVTARQLELPSMARLCSEARTWTPRQFASNLRTEVTSLERVSSATAADHAVFSTARPLRESR